MDKNGQNKNYNKIEYCLGSGLELLSAPTVLAVCQDSSAKKMHCVTKGNFSLKLNPHLLCHLILLIESEK